MQASFAHVMPKILIHEGGWANHPKDPGGATMKGVIQRVYDGYRQRKNLPLQSVAKISEVELMDIYKKQYWDAIKGDQLPQGVDYVVMDGAVNSGPSQSIKWLQRALGVTADGVIGQATLAAVEMINDMDALIAKILQRREAFLRALKTFKTFGKGWMSRVSQVKKIGQAWAVGSVGPTPVFFDNGNRRALIDDAKVRPSKAAADATSGGGAASLGLTGAINEARDQIAGVAGDSATLSYVLAGLAIVSVLSVVGGLAYRAYAKREEKLLIDALDIPAT